MLTKIKSFFKPNHFRDSKTVIEYAFTCGGVDYYQHVSEMAIPWRRAFQALTFYTEMDSKVDRAYLEEHVKAMDTLFTGKTIGFKEMAMMKTINDQLRERMAMIVIPDHVYKIASVRFFDRTENPDDYDHKYNEQKIALWKKHDDVQTFFLREPIVRLMPFLKSAPADLNQFSEAAEKLAQAHLENLLAVSSQEKRTELLNSIGKSFSRVIRPKKAV